MDWENLYRRAAGEVKEEELEVELVPNNSGTEAAATPGEEAEAPPANAIEVKIEVQELYEDNEAEAAAEPETEAPPVELSDVEDVE